MSTLSSQLTNLPPEQQAIRAKCFHSTGTFIEFRKEDIHQSISARFEEQARKYPDRLAVRTRDHSLTYAELNEAANRVANALLAIRGASQEPVALLFDNGAPFVVALLGALKTGKIQVPLQAAFPHSWLSYMLRQSQAAVLVTDSPNISLARELSPLQLFNVDEVIGDANTTDPGLLLAPGSHASIEYTSGSTGEPKGIVRTHRGALYDAMNLTNTFRICKDDRFAMFRAAMRPYLYALLNGATLYPIDVRKEETVGLANWLIQEEISVFRAAASVFRSFAGALTGAEEFPHLRLIALFGEPTYKTDVDLYRRHFADQCLLASSLGCSEFGDYAHYFLDKETSLIGGTVPGGYPVPDTEILLLDDEGHLVGDEQIGEIGIRSIYGAAGYWSRPDLTQAAFLPDPSGGDERIYRTGDLARIASDGCIFHLGRNDFQIKIRGHRVGVAEVEAALRDFHGVEEAVVVGREDTSGGQRLLAYLLAGEPDAPTVGELRHALAVRLPDYMVPSFFVFLDALPLLPNGKVDRDALPAPGTERPILDTPCVAPRTPLEETLARIWAKVLDLDQIGIYDNFMELGGHSLLATQVISRVIYTFGVELSVKALFESPTVAQMAIVIVQNQAKRAGTKEMELMLAELEALSDSWI